MRRFLVLTGIVAAVAVGFLAAWPRLVDSRGLQDQLLGQLRAAVGDRLRVEGAVRLELLPRPRLTLERAVLDAGASARLETDAIELRLAPLPLLVGRIEARTISLARPRLDLRAATGGVAEALHSLAQGPLAAVDRLEVHDGTVAGHAVAWLAPEIAVIDVVAVRDPVRGYRLDGSALVAAEPLRLAATADRLALDGPIQLTARLESGPSDRAFQAEFTGWVATGPAGEGRLALSSARGAPPRWLVGDVPLQGDLAGRLVVAPDRIELADLAATLPEGQLRGSLAFDLGPDGGFDLALASPALDLSPDLGGTALGLAEAVRTRSGRGGRLELELASATWRAGALRRVRAEAFLLPDGRFDLRRLGAALPGQTVLEWTGAAEPTHGGLAGAIALQAAELRALLGWLGVAEQDLPARGLATLDLRAEALLAPDRVGLRGLDARLDASRLTGTLSYARAGRPRLDAALAVDRLNLALYGGVPPGWSDWRSRLAALDGTLELAVDRLSQDLLAAAGIKASLTLDAGEVKLTGLTVADAAGAALALRGTLDLPTGAWDGAGSLDLATPGPALGLLGLPASFDLDRLAPLRLTGEGRHEAGRTSCELRLTADAVSASLISHWADLAAGGGGEASLAVEATEATAVLRALGWPAPPDARAFGPLAVTARAIRDGGPVAIEGEARVGDSGLRVALDLASGEQPPTLRGSVQAPLLDTALLAAIYQTLALPLGAPPGNPLLWAGVWPRVPLRWDWLDRLGLDLALAVERVRHDGREVGPAGAHATLADGVLGLERLDLPVAQGRLGGGLRLADGGGYGRLEADLRLAGVRAGDVAAAVAPGTTLRGVLDLALALRAQGRSIADLVASISGSGSLDLRDAELTGVELGGPVAQGGAPLLSGAALRGPLMLAGGSLTSSPPGLALLQGDRAATLDLRLDLLSWVLEARIASGDVVRRYVGPPGRIRPIGPP